MNSAELRQSMKAMRRRAVAAFARARELFWRVSDMLPPRFTVNEKTFFSKRLSFLVAGDVPILECLRMLRDQSRSRRAARVIDLIMRDVSNGKTLADALAKFPGMFDDFAVNIIRVGESSGILSSNLAYLAEEAKKKQELRRKLIGALLYPALVTVATISITVFLTVYLFPKIMPVFLSLNMKLPLSTRIVIGVSAFLQKHGVALLCWIVAAVVVFVVLYRRLKPVRRAVQQAALGVPVIGQMTGNYHLANFCRTMGLLLKSGVTLRDALAIATQTSSNLVYKAQFARMADAVDRGGSLGDYLRKERHLFADVLPQMVEVGERTGNLSNSLLYLSDFYEHEVDEFTRSLSGLLEPALMVGMGVLIGFIAISIITPIYGITQSLHP
jgi:type IV pilus assembly protein PilC